MEVRRIPVELARPLRNAILRPGYPPEKSIYPGDELAESFHAGAFLDGALVGVASIFNQPPPFGEEPNAWRLRGIAVIAAARRQGCGQTLVKACLAHTAAQGGVLAWCNARTSALPFYESLGFQKHGAEFDVAESGPHYVLWRTVELYELVVERAASLQQTPERFVQDILRRNSASPHAGPDIRRAELLRRPSPDHRQDR